MERNTVPIWVPSTWQAGGEESGSVTPCATGEAQDTLSPSYTILRQRTGTGSFLKHLCHHGKPGTSCRPGLWSSESQGQISAL